MCTKLVHIHPWLFAHEVLFFILRARSKYTFKPDHFLSTEYLRRYHPQIPISNHRTVIKEFLGNIVRHHRQAIRYHDSKRAGTRRHGEGSRYIQHILRAYPTRFPSSPRFRSLGFPLVNQRQGKPGTDIDNGVLGNEPRNIPSPKVTNRFDNLRGEIRSAAPRISYLCRTFIGFIQI